VFPRFTKARPTQKDNCRLGQSLPSDGLACTQRRQRIFTTSSLSFVYTAVFSPFAIFLLRTYYLAIPKELEEAAIIDGANRWQVFTKVLLPLVSPNILVTG
jgi:ABC-type glycerol-3-phosphate transport system permease component